MNKRSRALGYSRLLCASDCSAQTLMPLLLQSLGDIVEHDVALFLWTDASGNLTNLCSRNAAYPDVIAAFVERYVDDEACRYWPSLRQTMLQGSSNSLGSIRPCFYHSQMYAEIWVPNRIHWGMDWTIRDRGRSLGSLRLYRERHGPAFASSDYARLLPLLPHIASALARQTTSSEPWIEDEGPGVLVLNADGRCESMDKVGATLLFYATHPSVCAESLQWHGGGDMPPHIRSLCARLLRSPRPHDGVATQVQNPWGLFILRASLLRSVADAEGPKISLTLRREYPQSLVWARRLAAYKLSPRQAQVALLACQDLPALEIGHHLGIGEQTAVHHLRQAYSRLSVHGRDELHALVSEDRSRT